MLHRYVTGTAETTLAMMPRQAAPASVALDSGREGDRPGARTLNRLTAMAYLQQVDLDSIVQDAPQRYVPSFTRASVDLSHGSSSESSPKGDRRSSTGSLKSMDPDTFRLSINEEDEDGDD